MDEDSLFLKINTDRVMPDKNTIKISIMNYRSIEYLEILLDNFTQLIGQNNSGKSNILLAIKQAINMEKVLDKDFLDINKEIKIKINDYEYTAQKPGETFSCDKLKKNAKKPIEIIYLPAFPDEEDPISSTSSKALGQILSMFEKSKSNEIQNIIDEAKKKIEEIDSKRMEPINKALMSDLIECGLNIKNLKYSPSDVSESQYLNKRRLIIQDQWSRLLDWSCWGHGTQRLIMLMMYIQLSRLISKPDTEVLCILEEPEIFMHPQQQRAIADKLYQEVANSSFKIVLSTHSPFSINHMDLSNLRIIKKIEGKTIALNNGNGLTDYSPSYNHLQRKDMKEKSVNLMTRIRMEPNIKEIFFADKVIVVEGDDEKIAIPYLLKELCNYNIDANNISILNTKSNQGILNTVNALDDFNINFVIAIDDDFNNIPETTNAIGVIKKYLGNRTDNSLVIIHGNFCSTIGLVDKTEYNTINRIVDIKEGIYQLEDETNKCLISFLNTIKSLLLK